MDVTVRRDLFSTSQGLAIASKHMGAEFNRPGFPVIDNKVWTFCGDGCLQEGVASEAASLAGHLGLDNLVLIYDDNKVRVDCVFCIFYTSHVRHSMAGSHLIPPFLCS